MVSLAVPSQGLLPEKDLHDLVVLADFAHLYRDFHVLPDQPIDASLPFDVPATPLDHSARTVSKPPTRPFTPALPSSPAVDSAAGVTSAEYLAWARHHLLAHGHHPRNTGWYVKRWVSAPVGVGTGGVEAGGRDEQARGEGFMEWTKQHLEHGHSEDFGGLHEGEGELRKSEGEVGASVKCDVRGPTSAAVLAAE